MGGWSNNLFIAVLVNILRNKGYSEVVLSVMIFQPIFGMLKSPQIITLSHLALEIVLSIFCQNNIFDAKITGKGWIVYGNNKYIVIDNWAQKIGI